MLDKKDKYTGTLKIFNIYFLPGFGHMIISTTMVWKRFFALSTLLLLTATRTPATIKRNALLLFLDNNG
jgi:hypothetical protein